MFEERQNWNISGTTDGTYNLACTGICSPKCPKNVYHLTLGWGGPDIVFPVPLAKESIEPTVAIDRPRGEIFTITALISFTSTSSGRKRTIELLIGIHVRDSATTMMSNRRRMASKLNNLSGSYKRQARKTYLPDIA